MTKRMVRSALATVCAVVVALAVSAVAHVGVAHAATSAVYTAATVPSYSNPVTGSIEDSAGQSNIALAESMTTGCTYPAALVETDTAGNTFVTLRFKLADQMGVDIRLYSVIYDAIEEVTDAMEGMLSPEIKEEVTAQVEVRQVYHISKVGTVAGAYVIEGKVSRSNKARVIRDGIVVFTGAINALKRFKDDVKEVTTNFECGLSLVNYNDLREGDIIETFQEIEVKAKL